MVVKSAIEQVHADDTERFLLFDVGFIQQPHVDDNLARWAAFLGLKSHAEPSVRFIVLFKTARRHGVRKNEKRFFRSEFSIEPLHQPRVFSMLISLPGGNARRLLAVSAVASRAGTLSSVMIASARPLLPSSIS